jgi:transglutaminase-like putative cysteine protease
MRHIRTLAPFRVLVGGIFLTLCSSSVEARWAKPDDVDYVVESRVTEVWVQKDGTYREEVEDEITILKDSARITRGMVRLNYNPEVSSLEVLQAETIKGETHLSVEPHLIEDKPLASSGEGFDQWHQVLVAFPGVDVGSKVHFKYRRKWSQVPAPDFYSDAYYFATEYQKKGLVTLHSQLPLIAQINDPENALKISRTEHKKSEYPYELVIRLKLPLLRSVVDEVDPYVDVTRLPTVYIASSRDWSMVSKSVIAQYESTLNSPLPPLYQKIADAAREVQDPVERINRVTSRLADKVRYLGDWRTLKGKWIPRPLKTIAQSQFGDCKDFSASVAAILRSIGMQADVAWVWRGWNPVTESYELPSSFRFNHAIARVKSGNHVYWVDGTNVASFAQGIPGDIADRPALVLSSVNNTIERTPAQRADEFSYAFMQEMDFSKPDGIRISGTFKSNGGDAASWINGNLNTSQDTLNFKVVRAAARTDSVRDWKVSGFKIGSRIVRELNAKFQYVEKAQGYRSTAGLSYPILPPDAVDRLLFNSDQRESDIVLGEPFTYEREMLFKNVSVVGEENLACEVKSPWVDVAREVTRAPSGIRVRDRLQLKAQLLRHSSYTTQEFQTLQEKLVSCFRFSSVIYKSIDSVQRKSLR